MFESGCGNSQHAMYNIGLIKRQHNFDANGAVAVWKQMLKKSPNHPRRADVEKLIAGARQHGAVNEPFKSMEPTR